MPAGLSWDCSAWLPYLNYFKKVCECGKDGGFRIGEKKGSL